MYSIRKCIAEPKIPCAVPELIYLQDHNVSTMVLDIIYAGKIINVMSNKMKLRLNNPNIDKTKYQLLRKFIYSVK